MKKPPCCDISRVEKEIPKTRPISFIGSPNSIFRAISSILGFALFETFSGLCSNRCG
jgi:hypothetical protein